MIAMLTGLPWGKIALAIALFGSGFYTGGRFEKSSSLEALTELRAELTEALNQVKAELTVEKLERAAEKEEAARKAALELAASIEKARAVEAEAQAKITKITNQWNTRLKELQNDIQTVLSKNNTPRITADPLDDGMWVDAWACTASGGSGQDGVSQASGGTADEPLRCRLHQSVAERLVQRAAEANKVVIDYNACVDQLKVLSPQSFPAGESK